MYQHQLRCSVSWQTTVSACVFVLLSLCSCTSSRWVLEAHHTDTDAPRLHDAPHAVALLEDGRTALSYRLWLIRSARHSIRVQTFILNDDRMGLLILDELVQAARRGVTVQLLSDAMFTDMEAERLARLVRDNDRLNVRVFNPPTKRIAPRFLGMAARTLTRLRHVNKRMHNKLMIVDDRIAICGGRNIADEYYDGDFTMNFLDLDLVVEGPIVREMTTSFQEYWDSPLAVPAESLRDVAAAITESSSGASHRRVMAESHLNIQGELAENEPDLRWHRVQRVEFWADAPHKPTPRGDPKAMGRRVTSLLRQAKSDLLIQTPYLVLPNSAITLFRNLRARNVRVRVSTNSLSSTDNWLSYAHSLRQRRTVLWDLGIQIHEMKAYPADLRRHIPSYQELCEEKWRRSGDQTSRQDGPKLGLHRKAYVIDGRITLLGSYNLDPRSERLNTELGVVVWDAAFAQYVTAMIERAMHPSNSWVVAKRARYLPVRLVQMLMEEVNLVVMGTTTLDLWPLPYSSSFELRQGMDPVPPDHAEFYQRYRAVGLFPGISRLQLQPILVELTRILSGSLHPLV